MTNTTIRMNKEINEDGLEDVLQYGLVGTIGSRGFTCLLNG